MSQYALYTHFTTHHHKGDSLLKILLKANQIVSAAKGCRLYIVNYDIANKDSIWVTELWDSQEDHAISLTLDGCKELIVEAAPLLASEPKQIILMPVGGKGLAE
ncbi:MAG: antibiotic biosynthesis monooxygenase [Sediminibacterium sp.]